MRPCISGHILVLFLLSTSLLALREGVHFEEGSSSRPSQRQTLAQLLSDPSTSSSGGSSEWTSAHHPDSYGIEKDKPVPDISAAFRDVVLVHSSHLKQPTSPIEVSRKGKESVSSCRHSLREGPIRLEESLSPLSSSFASTSSHRFASDSASISSSRRSKKARLKMAISKVVPRLCKPPCFTNKRQ